MDDVNVNMSLSADEQDALKAAQDMAGGLGKIETAAKDAETALNRTEKAAAGLGKALATHGAARLSSIKSRIAEMTQAEYDALKPAQQRAIDTVRRRQTVKDIQSSVSDRFKERRSELEADARMQVLQEQQARAKSNQKFKTVQIIHETMRRTWASVRKEADAPLDRPADLMSQGMSGLRTNEPWDNERREAFSRLIGGRRFDRERVQRDFTARMAGPSDLISGGMSTLRPSEHWDVTAEDRIRRSNRLAMAQSIRREEAANAAMLQQRRMDLARGGGGGDGYNTATGFGRGGQGGSPRSFDPLGVAAAATDKFISAISKIGPALFGAAYVANDLASGYVQRMGVDYFESLKGIEHRYRPLMGLEDNGTRQQALREAVRNKAVSMGTDTTIVANTVAELQASSGNLSPQTRRELLGATMRLQTVAGGDLNTLGAGLISLNNLYGDQIGGVDRGAALFKATADYAKFSPTTLAQLGPDALAYFRAFGVGPEDALATLAVGSLRTGRPENFFTGMKYVASNMGRAVDRGWTTKDASWEQKLRDLSGRSPEELMDTNMFGREGFTAISEAIRGADEIKRVSANFRKVRGSDLARREMNLISDPMNMFSRLAQSVEVAGGQGYELLMEQGGPEGFNLAGKAIAERLAMEGQKLDNPVVASLTDKTKFLNLQMYKGKYTDMLLPHMMNAMAADGPAGALKAQALKLTTGKVQLGDVDPLSWQGFKNSVGNIGQRIPTTRASTGADAAEYLKMVREQRLYGMTAEEFGSYKTLKDQGRAQDAESLRSSLYRKYSGNDMNALVEETKKSADEIARASALRENAGPYAGITKPIDDYIETIKGDADNPFRIKAAEAMRDQLNRSIVQYDTVKGAPMVAAGAKQKMLGLAGSFVGDVNKMETQLLFKSFGDEYARRQNAMNLINPETPGYDKVKDRFTEIQQMATQYGADGWSRDELVTASKTLGLGREGNNETELGDKTIQALAAALAKEIANASEPGANDPTDSKSGALVGLPIGSQSATPLKPF